MLKKLPSPLKGMLNYSLLGTNTLLHSVPLLSVACLKLLPSSRWKTLCSHGLIRISENWISLNSFFLEHTLETQFHVYGAEALKYEGWYMVTSNHQSWADILVLQKNLNKKIPFLKFFLKKELIWVPVIGLCWWALDFPFMQRFSKDFLEKHPDMKGKDLEITKKACEKFKYTPVSIMNFLEGTRFTDSKHRQQNSPFHHLLKPKSGGAAYALNVLSEEIDTWVDITIFYPEAHKNELSFWDFMSGNCKNVVMHVKAREIPATLKFGDYENDPQFRQEFQDWINTLWTEKDALLEDLSLQFSS